MKQILIVDDDSQIRGSLATLLADKYGVGVASDGLEALAKLKEGAYDLILLDLVMPGLDGANVVRTLEGSGNRTPILLMSASSHVAERARGLAAGDYLGKPFHIDELEAKIDQLIGSDPAPDAAGSPSAVGTEAPGSAKEAKPHLVVLLDDDLEILALLKSLLADEPYEVLTTARPSEAMQWIESKSVNVMVCDQVMPGTYGTQLLQEVRARSPETRCAIFTAYPEGGKLLLNLSQEPLPIIPKPLDIEQLKRSLRALLPARESA